MKRIVLFLLVFSLLFLSSCKKTKSLEESYDDLLDRYAELEERSGSRGARLDEFESAVSKIQDEIYTVRDYYIDQSGDHTESQAIKSIERICDIIHKLGY